MSSTTTSRPTGRKPGRPKVADIPEQRLRHLICLSLHRYEGITIAWLADKARKTPRAVYYWIEMADGYPEARDEAYLRQLAQRYLASLKRRHQLLAG